MAGNHIKVDDKAGAVVEPAPEVGLVIRFNGQQQPVMLKVGETETLDFGSLPVEVKVVQIVRKPIRPAKKPPYIWVAELSDGTETRVRAMTERQARRMACRQSGEDILGIYPETN
jgi:hypothetical protein